MPVRLVAAFQEAVLEFEREASVELLRLSRELAPHHTGAFAASLQVRNRQSSAERFTEIFSISQKPKTVWTFNGYTINAKNKPYLVFQTYDGEWYSVKQVFHRPNPWPAKVLEATLLVEKLNDTIMRHLAAAFA